MASALAVAENLVDIGEAVGAICSTRRSRLRGAAAVRAHDLRRHRQPLLLIGHQRLARMPARASASARQSASRMACEAPFDPQDTSDARRPRAADAAAGPIGQGIAVAGRIFVKFGGRGNQARHIDIGHREPRDMRHQFSRRPAATSPRGAAAAYCRRRPSPAPPSLSGGWRGLSLPRSDRPPTLALRPPATIISNVP